MLAPVAHILPLTTIRRERTLPLPGRVTVRLEQKVTALEVVAETHYGQEHFLLDVAHQLGLPPEVAKKLISVQSGDQITTGQVIAQKKGLVPVTVKSPRSGRVVLSGGGQILLEIGEGAFELRAGLPGVVTRVIPERGVEIMFNGALVQGLWGNGRVESGLLHSLLTKPDDVLTASQLDVSLRGFILLAGHVSEAATLQSANDLQIRGMILSSLPPALLPVAMQMRLPIMVTDGFGRRPMNPVAYKLLTTNAKRDVTVNAEHYDRYRGTRPEVFIPLPVTQEPPEPREVETFAPGQQVRMCQAPHAGEIGTLLNLRMGLTLFPSGLHAPAAEIRLENGDQITAPLANLEVVG